MSESNIENQPGYCTPDEPPRWMVKLAILCGAMTLLMISGLSMVGAALLLVLNGY